MITALNKGIKGQESALNTSPSETNWKAVYRVEGHLVDYSLLTYLYDIPLAGGLLL